MRKTLISKRNEETLYRNMVNLLVSMVIRQRYVFSIINYITIPPSEVNRRITNGVYLQTILAIRFLNVKMLLRTAYSSRNGRRELLQVAYQIIIIFPV